MQSIENKVFSIIKDTGRGYVFSGADFIDKFNTSSIDLALYNLSKENKIRRVIRGIYDFPKYSKLLEQSLSPEIDKVAHALARKFKWRIEPSGNVALYLLGLSTQVPGRYIYFSDGPNRKYEIFGNQCCWNFASRKMCRIIKRVGADTLIHIGRKNCRSFQITITVRLFPHQLILVFKFVIFWNYLCQATSFAFFNTNKTHGHFNAIG